MTAPTEIATATVDLCEAEDEARIKSHVRRLRRVAEARRRAASELSADGLEQLDDLVQSRDDILDVARGLGGVVRSCADVVEQLLDLLVVHDSPLIGAADVRSSAVSAPIVGDASGVGASPQHSAPDAPSGADS